MKRNKELNPSNLYWTIINDLHADFLGGQWVVYGYFAVYQKIKWSPKYVKL